MIVLTFFLAASSLSSFVNAYSNGAGTCTTDSAAIVSSMGATNTPTLGYTLSFGTTTSYTAGVNVPLTIAGGAGSYTGFLIYATSASGTRVGTWTATTGVSQIGSSPACANDTTVTTHTSANPKPVTTVHIWVPPAASTGTVTFNVVIMMANRQFQIYTQTLSEAGASTTAAPGGATTTAPTQKGSAASFVSSPMFSSAVLLMAMIAIAFARV